MSLETNPTCLSAAEPAPSIRALCERLGGFGPGPLARLAAELAPPLPRLTALLAELRADQDAFHRRVIEAAFALGAREVSLRQRS